DPDFAGETAGVDLGEVVAGRVLAGAAAEQNPGHRIGTRGRGLRPLPAGGADRGEVLAVEVTGGLGLADRVLAREQVAELVRPVLAGERRRADRVAGAGRAVQRDLQTRDRGVARSERAAQVVIAEDATAN